ncbi:MAG: recombination protein O N-terminal domain-containing protein [Alphaproteobacteria bacterium]|nr:recombination protein O N-terminal domain-containing protein [Rickettsiales bacterium]
MRFNTQGIIVHIKTLQENGCIVHCITKDRGFISGFVGKIHSKKVKNTISIGNIIAIGYYGKEKSLGRIVPELIKSYTGSCIDNQLRLFVILCTCENAYFLCGKYHGLQDNNTANAGTKLIFDNIRLFFEQCSAMSDTILDNILIAQFIIIIKILLTESGYGFNLSQCVSTKETNLDELKFISPKSASAVSRAAAANYKNVFLPLPKFFITHKIDISISVKDITDGLLIVDRFLKKVSQSYVSIQLPNIWDKTKNLIDKILERQS